MPLQRTIPKNLTKDASVAKVSPKESVEDHGGLVFASRACARNVMECLSDVWPGHDFNQARQDLCGLA